MNSRASARTLLSALAASLALCVFPAAAQSPVGADNEAALLALLAEDPSNAEARFRLGRLYFETRRDRAADFNLRQARAQQLSPESAAEALDLLAALQKRRRWIVRGDFAVAPQTSQDVVEDSAVDGDTPEPDVTRELTSGAGIIANASIEHRASLSPNTRLSAQLVGRALEYEGARFDNMTLTALVGPLRLQEGDNLWSARPLYQRNWRSGEIEYDAYGGEIAVQRSVADRVRAFARLNVRQVDYETFNARDGLHSSADATVTRYGRNGRLERVITRVFRAEAEEENQQFWFTRAAVGGYREIGLGFGAYLEPFVSLQDFDGVTEQEGVGRRDLAYGGRARIVKRDWRVFFGAAPFVELSARRVRSNIDRYDGDDDAVAFGFTQTF